jgi:hypothetical protein
MQPIAPPSYSKAPRLIPPICPIVNSFAFQLRLLSIDHQHQTFARNLENAIDAKNYIFLSGRDSFRRTRIR